jgi:hypothetical protein
MPRCFAMLFAIVSGGFLALCFPRYHVDEMVWLWSAPLLLALWWLPVKNERRRFRRGFWLGYLAGIVFFGINLVSTSLSGEESQPPREGRGMRSLARLLQMMERNLHSFAPRRTRSIAPFSMLPFGSGWNGCEDGCSRALVGMAWAWPFTMISISCRSRISWE